MQRSASLSLFMVLALFSAVRGASISVLPDLWTSGGGRQILRLMPDGQSVMGVQGSEVFRWTQNSGRVVVGQIPPQTLVTAISGDGSTVIGRTVDFSGTNSFRWNASSGTTILPKPAGFPYNSSPEHVSYDGSLIYGVAESIFNEPFVDLMWLGMLPFPYDFPDYYPLPTVPTTAVFSWSASAGAQLVQDWALPSVYSQRNMVGLSADGSVLGGTWDGNPVLWNALSGGLDTVPPPALGPSYMQKLSADGTTIAGKEWSTINLPFRWRVGHAVEFLTDAKGYSDVYAISADGNTILGYIDPDNGDSYTFVWRPESGMQPIEAYFAEHGLTLPGHNYSVTEMSDDGLVFRGYSYVDVQMSDGTLSNQATSWIADLHSAVPEPTSLAQLVPALLLLVGARRAGR